MANNPELLKMPLARDGQKSTIPETATASAGIFSQQYGWQGINSLPPQAGGKAVKREDFNGAFNLLGGIAFMAQKGFTFKWNAEQDYYAGCVVIDDTDGLRYECIADVTANSTVPSADATHWQIFSAGTDIEAWFRQPNTQYGNGAIALLLTLPTGWYLECTGTGGTTSASDLVITSPTVGTTVTDGTVIWTIRKLTTVDIPNASSTVAGIMRLYASTGSSTNGTMTQQAITNALNNIESLIGGGGGIIAASLDTNGYVKFKNGFILQWVKILTGNTSVSITFPISFTTSVYSMHVTRIIESVSTSLDSPAVRSYTKSSATINAVTSNPAFVFILGV
jgi:hypothetical protein